MISRHHRLTPLALLAAALLAGCTAPLPPREVAAPMPAQWFAPLPHGGSLTGLADWWQQQGDAVLVELIRAAQAVSPSVSAARATIEQARSTRVAANAARLPNLDGTGSLTRSQSAPVGGFGAGASDSAQLGLQASWELDVLGKNSRIRSAADERLLGAQAQWHDARVSVAAEVARQYYSFRACEQLVQITAGDANSRAETARLSSLATQAGFEAPANAALASASASDSRARATQQRALCDIDVKTLVALTATDEPLLRQQLALGTAPADTGAPERMASPSSLPAELLGQRPDVYNAARELAAAAFEVGSADAERYPRLSLSGAITAGRVSSGSFSQNVDTWSIGPLALTVPIFEGGATRARLGAAKARYENAANQYRGTARQAVREVEEALVNLQSTADRTQDAARAADGYRAFFDSTQARYKSGLASLVELEDARRTRLSAQSAVVNLALERRNAWVALYRALGGGWNAAAPGADQAQARAVAPP